MTYGTPLPGDLVGYAQRLVCVELVVELLPRRRFGTAMQAAEIAIPRQLPGDEQRRAELIDPVRSGNANPTPKRECRR